MGMTVIDQPVQDIARSKRWTVNEYLRLVNNGLLEGQYVQLIDGDIVEMAPQKEPHAVAVLLGARVLRDAFGVGFTVRPQLPFRLGAKSLPEPDLVVVVGDERSTLKNGTPNTALLVVEISDSSLLFDQTKKLSMYADGNISDYWIINLSERVLEVYRQPKAGRYTLNTIHLPGERVSPLGKPDASISVDDLLP